MNIIIDNADFDEGDIANLNESTAHILFEKIYTIHSSQRKTERMKVNVIIDNADYDEGDVANLNESTVHIVFEKIYTKSLAFEVVMQ